MTLVTNVDLANALVLGIGDVNIAGGVASQGDGAFETGGGCHTTIAPYPFAPLPANV